MREARWASGHLPRLSHFAKTVGNSNRAQNSNGPVYRNFGRMEPLAAAAGETEVSSSSKTDRKFQSTFAIIDMEKEALKMT